MIIEEMGQIGSDDFIIQIDPRSNIFEQTHEADQPINRSIDYIDYIVLQHAIVVPNNGIWEIVGERHLAVKFYSL